MFLLLLIGLGIGATVHVLRSRERTPGRAGEIVLLWLLVGYCGIPMLAVSIGSLVAPDRAAEALGFPTGNPYQHFTSVAILGMSIAAILALRYRGAGLVGPTVAWAVFWAGATGIHVADLGGTETLDAHLAHHVVYLFLVHGLVAILLLGALAASGVARRGSG